MDPDLKTENPSAFTMVDNSADLTPSFPAAFPSAVCSFTVVQVLGSGAVSLVLLVFAP